MHGVARPLLKFDVLFKQLRARNPTISQVSFGSHHTEDAAKAIIAQGIGVVGFLPGYRDGIEHFGSTHVMDRKPFEPCVHGVAYSHTAERSTLGAARDS